MRYLVGITVVLLTLIFGRGVLSPARPSTMEANANQWTLSSEPAPQRQFNDWQKFSSLEHSFSIEAPRALAAKPSQPLIRMGSGTMQYTMWAAEDADQGAYSMNIIVYPPSFDLSDPFAVLEGLLDDILVGSTGSVRRTLARRQLGPHPELGFTLEGPEAKAVGNMLLVDQKLYLYFYMHTAERFDAEAGAYFLDTFEVL